MSALKAFTPEFEYEVECHQYLIQKERQRLLFTKSSPELSYREELVQRIKVLCICLDFTIGVKYLSIYILDFFMDNHSIIEDKLELTAICSLMIAAKVDERDNRIPKYSQLFSESNQFSSEEVLEMEIKILEFFDWVFLTPTPATYIDYFFTKCLPELQSNKANKAIVNRILDKSLDIRFYKFSPSVIAASAVYYTRERLSLRPIWPKNAQNVTKYSLKQIEKCVQEFKVFDIPSKLSFVTNNKTLDDSGFIDSV